MLFFILQQIYNIVRFRPTVREDALKIITGWIYREGQ
jgi:membrane protein YdbS with pleckstrin-like domain